VETLTRQFLADLFDAFADVWREAARIHDEELTAQERATAAASPEDLREAVFALAPLVARNTRPDVMAMVVAVFDSGAVNVRRELPDIDRRPEDDCAPVTLVSLAARLERLETATRMTAGVWSRV